VATAIRQLKAGATATNRVRAVFPNSFFVLSRMLVIRENVADVGGLLGGCIS
jgi:hypothetical protein